MPVDRGLRQCRITGPLGLVEQSRASIGCQGHDPLEVREIRHGTQLPQVPLQIGLYLSGEPELSCLRRGCRERRPNPPGQPPLPNRFHGVNGIYSR